MPYRLAFRKVIALSLAVASLAASPVRAEQAFQSLQPREMPSAPAQVEPAPLVLAPAAESCFVEYTGDSVTDFTSLDAQA